MQLYLFLLQQLINDFAWALSGFQWYNLAKIILIVPRVHQLLHIDIGLNKKQKCQKRSYLTDVEQMIIDYFQRYCQRIGWLSVVVRKTELRLIWRR